MGLKNKIKMYVIDHHNLLTFAYFKRLTLNICDVKICKNNFRMDIKMLHSSALTGYLNWFRSLSCA